MGTKIYMRIFAKIFSYCLAILMSLMFSVNSFATVLDISDGKQLETSYNCLEYNDNDLERNIIVCETHYGTVELSVSSTYDVPKVVAFIKHTKEFSVIPCNEPMYWTLEWEVRSRNGDICAKGVRTDGGAPLAPGMSCREVFTSGQIAFGCYFNVRLTTTAHGETDTTEWGGVELVRPEE